MPFPSFLSPCLPPVPGILPILPPSGAGFVYPGIFAGAASAPVWPGPVRHVPTKGTRVHILPLPLAGPRGVPDHKVFSESSCSYIPGKSLVLSCQLADLAFWIRVNLVCAIICVRLPAVWLLPCLASHGKGAAWHHAFPLWGWWLYDPRRINWVWCEPEA